jgi:DNA-binding NtrC family response regulator
MSKSGFTSGSRRAVESGVTPRTLAEIMASYERIVIIKALQVNGFCRSKTALSLGLQRANLYHRMRLLGINLGDLPRSKVGRPRKTVGKDVG